MAICVRRSFGIGARELAAASRATLDVLLADEAELWLARPSEDAVTIGAFQRRAAGLQDQRDPAAIVAHRGSGGPAVRMGEGTLWMALLLSRVDALTSCDPPRLVNRYVRPLLRALSKCGALAHFFGRDWVSVQHRPAAWVGFSHDGATGRAVIEAFIARTTPFWIGPRASFRGKEPGTLESIVGTPIDEARLADAITLAYADAYGRAAVDRGSLPHIPVADSARAPGADPPWAATIEEIGEVGAGLDGSGVFRVGGALLVSRDALAALEARALLAAEVGIGAAVEATLGAPGVALEGIQSLTTVRDVIVAARRSAFA